MKNLYWLCALLPLFYSCSEIEEFPNDLSPQASINPITRFAGDEKYDVLGYGYDVTGEYLHPLSVRNPVLDMAKYEKDYSERLQHGTSSYGYDRMYCGYSSVDYIKDITAETKATATMNHGSEKDTLFFSNTITDNAYLKTEYSYSSKYSFASLDVIRNLKYIHINDEVSRLSLYLSDSFKEDLERLSPDRVVERYGTHVLTDFIIGGHYKLLFRSVITKVKDGSTKRKTVSSGFKSSLDGIGFSYNLEHIDTVDESLVKENQHKELYVMFYGGSGTNMKYDLEKGAPTSVDIQSWEKSVSLGNSCLNDINWKETYPIYDFISDPIKKEQIKEATLRYIDSKKIKSLSLSPMFEMYDPGTKDRYYVFSWDMVQREVNVWGAEYRGHRGYILNEAAKDTQPMYEMYDPGTKDRYYVFSWDMVQREVSVWRAEYRGYRGYVFNKSKEDTQPMYEMYDPGTKDRYYVFSWDMVQREVSVWRAEYRDLNGYILSLVIMGIFYIVNMKAIYH